MTTARVREALEVALGPGAVATHRHNHTGTGKLFDVLAGRAHLWAKVAADDEEDAALRTWASVAALLAERHSAPRCSRSSTSPATRDCCSRSSTPRWRPGPPCRRGTPRCRPCWTVSTPIVTSRSGSAVRQPAGRSSREVWVSRFETDLRIIAGHVAPDVHAYLATEVEVLSGLVDSLEDRVHVAIHGDPWHENVLLASDRVWLLDWEDLSVGDPVIDDAILRMDVLGSDDWPAGARFDIARRALLLDAALDGAADWVENSDPAIRAGKERAYLEGLAAYRAHVAST